MLVALHLFMLGVAMGIVNVLEGPTSKPAALDLSMAVAKPTVMTVTPMILGVSMTMV